MEIIALVASILSIIGAILVAKKSVWGFYLWIVSNSIWLVFDILIGLWEQVPIWFASLISSVYGVVKWGEKEDTTPTRYDSCSDCKYGLLDSHMEPCNSCWVTQWDGKGPDNFEAVGN